MSGACAVAADERLAAYDFGPDRPFQAGRLAAGLSLLRAANVLGEDDLWPSNRPRTPTGAVHDRTSGGRGRFSPRNTGAHGRAGPVRAVGDNRRSRLDEAARLSGGDRCA